MKLSQMFLATLLVAAACFAGEADGEGWITLFDGKSLDGWKATEKTSSFSIRDGMLCVEDGRSHLFYVGPVAEHNFKSFEFKAEVMTTPGANSGIYFHTKFQARGWPSKGYEAQVNTTHRDRVKTGSIYHVRDITKAPTKDNEWFTYHIIVQGRRITIKINDKVVNEYTEPESVNAPRGRGRRPPSGTFAIQGHDPKSKVYYRNIRVKVLAG